jgi:biotin operon repressor
MQQPRFGNPEEMLTGVKIALLAAAEESLVPVEQALWRAGARVQRIAPSDLGPSALADVHVVVVRVGGPTGPRPGDAAFESIRPLLASTRTVALVEETPVPVPPELADFVVAPFHPEEVIARIARLLIGRVTREVMRAGNLALEPGTRAVVIDGRPIDATYREFEILRALLEADGRVLSRSDLAARLGSAGTGRAVDIHVHRLRAKCVALRGARIDTIRGVGYRLTREG